MVHTHLSLPTSPPAAYLSAAARPAFHWHCHLPLALERTDLQAELVLGFRFDLASGPLTQGSAIRSVTLPPCGAIQILLHESQSHLILETDSLGHHRCGTVPAETNYLHDLRRALRRLGLPQNNCHSRLGDGLHIGGSPVSFPFLTPVLESLIDRAEAASRVSEAAARTSRVDVPILREPELSPRTLSNSNRLRALTVSFHHAEKYQLARLELHQIDRVVKASTASIAAAVEADIDRNLLDLALTDSQGRVTPAARSRFGWQRTFRLPTPYVLAIEFPVAAGAANVASEDSSVDLRPDPGCAARRDLVGCHGFYAGGLT